MKSAFVTIVLVGVPMKIAVYYRVSTDQQSIEHQRKAVNDWITERGYDQSQVLTFSDEGISGAINDGRRTGFTRLVESILSGTTKKVLVFETSRLSRDFMAYLNFLDLCRKNQCAVEVIGKGAVDFNSSEDMLLASIAAFTAQVEREKIRERVKSGVKAAQARGVQFGAKKGEQRRLGFRKEHDPALIRCVLELHREGLNTRAISRVISQNQHLISHSTVATLIRKYGQKEKS